MTWGRKAIRKEGGHLEIVGFESNAHKFANMPQSVEAHLWVDLPPACPHAGWTYENAAEQDVERWGPIEESFWSDIREAWTGA